MLRSSVLSALLGVAVCLAATACSKVERPPALCADCNVVLISMDTVRADRLGIYGHTKPTSPNVDRFAEHALVFENAISQSAWTLPAHGSMMTGLYPGRLGVVHYPAKRSLPKVRMLAEEFRSAGYATGGFTGGGFVASHFGFARGFDIYTSDGRRFEHNIEEAVDWLKQHKERRFFLFLHGYDAHRPYFSSAGDKSAIGLRGKRSAERRNYCLKAVRDKPADLDVVLQYYDASIRHGDRSVGYFLNALTGLGLADRTVVLITSDHGEEFYEHGHCDHVRFLYREIVNVPLLLRVPGLDAAMRRIPDVVPASISIARTLLEIVGLDTKDFPGPSLMPLLKGEPSPFRDVYSETESVSGSLGSRGATIAVTTAKQKLISYLDEGTDEGYDVVNDPGEQHVLPKSHAVYQQRVALRSWKSSLVASDGRAPRGEKVASKSKAVEPTDTLTTGAEPEKDSDELPPALRKQLESLGYLEGE